MKEKNQPHDPEGNYIVVIIVNAIIVLVVLPFALLAHQGRNDLFWLIALSALGVPALVIVLRALYRSFWPGMAILTTIISALAIIFIAIIVASGFELRLIVQDAFFR